MALLNSENVKKCGLLFFKFRYKNCMNSSNCLKDAGSAMDAMTENSYKVAKENAEFYREQLELLREDVEAQNARISQHYEEKVSH